MRRTVILALSIAGLTLLPGQVCVPTTDDGTSDGTTFDPLVVNAGTDATIGLATSMTLGGSPAVTGGDGTYTYEWLPTLGLSNPSIPNPTFTPPWEGPYTFTLTITDGQGTTAFDTVTIMVAPGGGSGGDLTADAGSDQTGQVSVGVTLGGSPAADGGSGNYTYAWSPTTGLNDSAAANPVFTPTATGTFTFTLTVTDSLNDTASDTATITVPADSVVADAGPDTTGQVGTSVRIGGSPSAKSGDGTYTYAWTPTTGLDDPTAANPMFTPPSSGAYTFTLTVTDGTGDTATDSVVVTVPLDSVIADAGPDKTVQVGTTVALGGSPSARGGDGNYTYAWTPTTGLDDAAKANPAFSATSAGTYTFTLTVTDSKADTATDTLIVTVTEPLITCGYYPDTLIKKVSVGSYPDGVVVSPDASIVYVTNSADDTVSVVQTADHSVTTTVSVGDGPRGLALSPFFSWVYVTNANSDTVSVIRTSDNTVAYTIPVGDKPTAVAVSPDGTMVYVTNSLSGTLSVIQTSDHSVIQTVDVGLYPYGVAVSPDGSTVYVSLSIADSTADKVLAIRSSDLSIIEQVPVGDGPLGLTVSADGLYAYVCNSIDDTISVIRTSDHTVVDTFPVGTQPYGVAVSPDGDYVYVTNTMTDTMLVIRDSDHTIINTISVGESPKGVAMSPDGCYVYVAVQHELAVIGRSGVPLIADAGADKTVQVDGAVSLGGSPTASGGDGHYTYVWVPSTGLSDAIAANPTFTATTVGSYTFTLSVTDGEGETASDTVVVTVPAGSSGDYPDTVVKSITVGTYPYGIAVVPDGSAVYVSNSGDDTLSVISTADLTVTDTISLGSGRSPMGVTVSPSQFGSDGYHVYVVNNTANTLSVIRTSDRTVIAEVSTEDPAPTAVAVSPDGSRVYTSNSLGRRVALVDYGSITAIETTNYTYVGTAAKDLPLYPYGVVVSADNNSVFVCSASESASTISRVRKTDLAVMDNVTVGTGPFGLAMSPGGGYLYVSNSTDNTISVVRTADFSLMNTIPVGQFPAGLAVSPDGSYVYVANRHYDDTIIDPHSSVSVVRVSDHSVINTIPVGLVPMNVAITPDGNTVFVANHGYVTNPGNTVSVIAKQN